ncbi:RbsD/FucU domain-containing protein [Kosakonia sp. H02]|nr:RbsD/FucU domain-containing protein [Kosakonia sp. H02]
MLKNINPLLGPELLAVLCSMGHGEDIAIVDRNYAATTAGPKVIRYEGVNAPALVDAILTVLPVDKKPEAVVRMQKTDQPDEILPVMKDFINVFANHVPDIKVDSLTTANFKLRAARSVAIVVTGEERVYGNILVRKGVL